MHKVDISPILMQSVDLTLEVIAPEAGATPRVATSSLRAIAPIVTAVRHATVTAVRATSTANGIAPIVGGATSAFINAVCAIATGSASAPASGVSATVTAVRATATARSFASVTPTDVTVTAVKAASTSTAPAPVIIDEIVLTGGGRGRASALAIPPTVSSTGGAFGFAEPRITSRTSTEQDTWLADMASMGMTWIRFDISWWDIQPTNAGSYNWAAYDALLLKCANNGLKVLGTMYYTPPWARPAGTDQMSPPTDLNAYATFAAAAVQHFGNKVAAYEIWNEPNTTTFWKPTPSPATYTQLLKLAANAMRAINPNVIIVTAGLAPAATSGSNYSPIDFVTGIYANGGQPYFTALGHHPYCYPAVPAEVQSWSGWSQMSQTSPSIRSVMVANGDTNKAVWMTELGGPTNGPEGVRGCSDALGAFAHYDQCMQARDLQQAISISKTLSWSGPLFIYTYKDKGTDTSTMENFFGVIDTTGAHKQAYDVVVAEI